MTNAGAGAGGRDLGRALVSASADGIVAVDDRGVIRLCNPAAEELLDRPAAELVGSVFGFPLAAGATEIELVLAGGRRRVVDMRVTSTTWEGERLHVAALRDVTRRREVERELEAALEHQNVIVAVAAHELRNPLAAIAVLADVLRDPRSVLTDEQGVEMIERIAERARHLQALVRKLLTASRIDAAAARTRPGRVPVLEFLFEQVARFEDRLDDVRVSCSPELVASVVRAEFAEMLTNYLENAIVYARPPISVQAVGNDGWVEIRVRDAGPGVPEAFVPYLFDRFTREPAAALETEGTGLGLWIVRSLAQANGGEAWYEHANDGGACFCLRLRRVS